MALSLARKPQMTIFRSSVVALVLAGAAALTLTPARLAAFVEVADQIPTSLLGLPVPEPAGLDQVVVDREAAVVLGKALFWDAQVGSDGVTACATCHHHAGADSRRVNQLSPAQLSEDDTEAASFSPLPGGANGPNATLTNADFPTRQLVDELDRESPVLFDSTTVIGSAGVFRETLVRPRPKARKAQPAPSRVLEACAPVADPVFHVSAKNGGWTTRQVTPRHSPSVVNAAFNIRQFWDGRAQPEFNGQNPFGMRDASAGVWEALPGTRKRPGGIAFNTGFRLNNASLASQAVGPVGSSLEMACLERTFPFVGRKLLGVAPLALQQVSPSDSVLGAYVRAGRVPKGLRGTYADLVKRAFHPRYWDTTLRTPDGWTLMEANFSMFFGLSVQLYEMTLISDQAPFDSTRWAVSGGGLAGDIGIGDGLGGQEKTFIDLSGTLSQEAQRGFSLFMTKGNCVACHRGALFTAAAFDPHDSSPVEWLYTADRRGALYDNGFYNIGVRPTREDLGLGAVDPVAGLPLSIGRRQYPGLRHAVDGAFKTPGLRNVALTGPYFHNGSRGTLEQVMTFYNRGGDRVRTTDVSSDTTGFNGNPTNQHPEVTRLFLSFEEMDAIVTFLREALTDERVRCEQAPFDHPSLALPTGHSRPVSQARRNAPVQADDRFLHLPAVGAEGRVALGLPGLAPFLSQGAPCGL